MPRSARLHVRPILDMRQSGPAGGAAKMRAIADEAAALVAKFKGAYSGEHGDGLCRGEWIGWQFGPNINEAFRAIKHKLDPGGLMNPGKIIDPPKMDDASLFRFAPGYRTIALTPVFDWSAWNVQNDPVTEATSAPGSGGDATGGLAKAVEMCNNNGHCRKFDAGTMCPSYRVTRDEQHLTRGRANTLRLALSGQLGADALTGDAVAAALDLCVGCKGCKRDCPTGVDMAKMKLEVQAQRRLRHGVSLRDQLLAHLPAYAGLASRVPWLMNLRNRVPLLRRASERWLGLSAARSLPRFRRDTFWRGAAALQLATRAELLEAEQPVVLFVDTFNGQLESENAVAAVRVLQSAGYTVHAARGLRDETLCCGRTYLAAGMAEEAKARARQLLDSLLPLARRGIAIVGLEPSCLLTLRDEMLSLGLGEDAHTVAGKALLFEEFLAGEAKAGRFRPALRAARSPMRVHGHCHQKAFGAMPPVLEVLRLIPGAEVDADRKLLLRHGRQLRLRGRAPGRLDADGRTEPAACRARRARGADRRRRHQLPAPDRRRRRPRGLACGAGAGRPSHELISHQVDKESRHGCIDHHRRQPRHRPGTSAPARGPRCERGRGLSQDLARARRARCACPSRHRRHRARSLGPARRPTRQGRHRPAGSQRRHDGA